MIFLSFTQNLNPNIITIPKDFVPIHGLCIEKYLDMRRNWILISCESQRLSGAVERERYFMSFTLFLEFPNQLFGFRQMAYCKPCPLLF